MSSTQRTALTALSSLDGRYSKKLLDSAAIFSDFSLTKKRLEVETAYLLFLSQKKLIPAFTQAQKKKLHGIAVAFSEDDAEKVQEFEAVTRHDVKAIEYFLREKMRVQNLPNDQFIHAALTSEDTNALAYGLMLQEAVMSVILPELRKILLSLDQFVQLYRQTPMLARTHGQAAIATTVGKEFAVFAQRLLIKVEELEQWQAEGKVSGAVGTYAAHSVLFPSVNPVALSEEFIVSLGLKPNLVTTQILPAENYSSLFALLIHINCILLDLNQDCWRYISDGFFAQKPSKGQVGSSTMPQKINPIDFENSEGNVGLANALLVHFMQKLPVSRLQRDLSDSTVKRSIGSAFGYCMLAYRSLLAGLSKITVKAKVLEQELLSHWEVLAEPYQLLLRGSGIPDGFEQLKKLTQGKTLTQKEVFLWIEGLDAGPKLKQQLLTLTPLNYIGESAALADAVHTRISAYGERTA